METNYLRWLFITVLATLFALGFVGDPVTFGISTEWSNGSYRFAGGTHPTVLALALLTWALFVLLMYAAPTYPKNPLPGVFRRFVAFWLDFILAMTAIAPMVGILPTLVEWKRTGVFEWNVDRTTYVTGDSMQTTVGILLTITGLISYYAIPLVRCRPSPGTCIAGYQVVPDDGVTLTPKLAVLRTVLGFVAACAAYLAPFVARDRKKGKFWLDKVCGTHAVKLV